MVIDSTFRFMIFRMLSRTQKHFSPFTHLSWFTNDVFAATKSIAIFAALKVMMHNFDAISHLINSSMRLKFDKKICQECTWSVSLFEIHTVRPPPLWFVNDTLLVSLFTALSWPVILSFSIRLTIHPHNRETFDTLFSLLSRVLPNPHVQNRKTKIQMKKDKNGKQYMSIEDTV